MQKITSRHFFVFWLYGIALVHVAAGVLLPWVANSTWLENYHRSIEAGFWVENVPEGARALHVWWLSLFGPTIQTLGIWMFALIYMGEKHRSSFVWLLLFIGFAIWAPQDILISLRINAIEHVWIDMFVLVIVLPPLMRLWFLDRNTISEVKTDSINLAK